MRLSKCLSIVLALLAAVTTLSAGQEDRTNVNKKPEEPLRPMTRAEYQQFLGSLKTDLARWQSQLAEIDIGSLNLDFRRGKLIERNLDLAKRATDQCQKWVSEQAKRQSLGDSVRLYSSVESLGENLSGTMDMLSEFGGESTRPDFWYGQLLVVLKEVHVDEEKLFGHVLALSDIADASCPQLGRYLH